MKKLLTALVAVLLVSGMSAAVVGNDAGDKPSITDNKPDDAGQPEDVGPGDKKPNQSQGVGAKAKGLAMAASKVPGDVANAVIGPLQDGATGLGQMFNLGDLLGGGSQEPSNTTNTTDQ